MSDEERVEMSCAPQPKPAAEHEARPMAVTKSTLMHRVAGSMCTQFLPPRMHRLATSDAHDCSL
jgi:hypothetical protein